MAAARREPGPPTWQHVDMTPRRCRWATRLAEALLGAFAFGVFVAVVPATPTGPAPLAWSPTTLRAGLAAATATTPATATTSSGAATARSGGVDDMAAAPKGPSPAASGPAATMTGPKDVLVVGDSLTVGTEPWLSAVVGGQGWTLTGVDARVGRGVPEGLSVLRTDIASLAQGTVVVALGTNDLNSTAAQVAGWLASARRIVGSRRLIWINLCLAGQPGTWLGSYRQINRWLADYAPRYQVQVADWCSFATRSGIQPGPDGIHYAPAAYRQRAAFYAATIAG